MWWACHGALPLRVSMSQGPESSTTVIRPTSTKVTGSDASTIMMAIQPSWETLSMPA